MYFAEKLLFFGKIQFLLISENEFFHEIKCDGITSLHGIHVLQFYMKFPSWIMKSHFSHYHDNAQQLFWLCFCQILSVQSNLCYSAARLQNEENWLPPQKSWAFFLHIWAALHAILAQWLRCLTYSGAKMYLTPSSIMKIGYL